MTRCAAFVAALLLTACSDGSRPSAPAPPPTQQPPTDGGTNPPSPPGQPPTVQKYSLTGTISDATTHSAIGDARIEVLGGANVGIVATTDASGTYVLKLLAAETFRLRASAGSYDPGEQNVTIPTNTRADFELRRTAPCVYATDVTSLPGVPRSGGQVPITITRTSGGCSWSASSTVDWMQIAGSTSGSNSSALSVNVAAMPSASTREGDIVVQWSGGSTAVRVIQAGCEVATFPATIAFLADGSVLNYPFPSKSYGIGVWSTNPLSCPWNVQTNDAWIAIAKANQSFSVSVSTNASATTRAGNVKISWIGGSATVAVTQSGIP